MIREPAALVYKFSPYQFLAICVGIYDRLPSSAVTFRAILKPTGLGSQTQTTKSNSQVTQVLTSGVSLMSPHCRRATRITMF